MAMHTDPVCGMQVDDQRSPAKSEYQGTDYYFCSNDCKRKFDQQPGQYTGSSQRGGQSQGSGQAQRGGSSR